MAPDDMAEVDCPYCKQTIYGSTIQMAMQRLERHKADSHFRKREPVGSEDLVLNGWDRKFLFFCGISQE